MDSLTPLIASNTASFAYLLPELTLIVGALGLLLLDLFIEHRRARRMVHTLLCLSTLITAFVLLFFRQDVGAMGLFNGLLVHDAFSWFFRAFALLAAIISVLMVPGYPELPTKRIAEFYALLMTIVLGLLLLPAATDILTIVLSLEIVSLLSYVLTGFRQGNRDSAEGSLKYVIFGGVSTGVMLYGFSLLFGLCGGTSLSALNHGFFRALEASGAPGVGGLGGSPVAFKLIVAMAVVFILAGFAYKIAAAPFHLWTPDAYEGAPTPFTAFLSVAPKAAGLALFIRFFLGVFSRQNPSTWSAGTFQTDGALPWTALLAILAMATMTVGNLTALRQVRLKRLLAFSSIAHAGTMLMGIAAGTRLGAEAVLVYAGIYLFMNLGAFGLVSALSVRLGGDHIKDLRGLSSRAPFAAFALAVFFFSLTGIPPLAGFVAKFYIFYAVILKGGALMWTLAIVGGLNGAMSLFYYANVVRAMYFEEAVDKTPVKLGLGAGALAFGLLVPVFILGVYWSPMTALGHAALKNGPLEGSLVSAVVAERQGSAAAAAPSLGIQVPAQPRSVLVKR